MNRSEIFERLELMGCTGMYWWLVSCLILCHLFFIYLLFIKSYLLLIKKNNNIVPFPRPSVRLSITLLSFYAPFFVLTKIKVTLKFSKIVLSFYVLFFTFLSFFGPFISSNFFIFLSLKSYRYLFYFLIFFVWYIFLH